MKRFGIRNKYTNEVVSFNTRMELDAYCNENGIKLNSLERAHREGRESLTGWAISNTESIKTALLVSDIHFCYEDKQAMAILYKVISKLGSTIDEYIDCGDGINNDALSVYTCVEDVKYTLYDEITSYKNHMKLVRAMIPNAKLTVLEDNHFHLRKQKFLAANPAMIGLIPDLDDVVDEKVQHGKLYFPFGQRRFGCIHGISTNDFFTKVHMSLYSKYDVFNGHTHTLQTYVSQSGTEEDEPRRAYGVPSMCQRMAYTSGKPTRQVTGFTIVTYDSSTDNYVVENIIIEKGSTIFRGEVIS